MSNTLTHWKKLHNPNYIGAYSLMESTTPIDLIVSIQSIAVEEVKGEDGKKDQCTVAKLHGQKPFIVNATNAKMLTKLFGSPFIENWINKPFTLYVAKIKVAGEVIDALRIRPTLPVIEKKELPELTPTHPKWDAAKESIKTGKTELSDVLKHYTISEANQKLLIA